MNEKYIIFKDDDVGKDLPGLKRWIDIILENKAKGAIGLIGKYLDKDLANYLNSLDSDKIEVFCHGYSHSHIPFMLRKIIGRNRILPTEFDRNIKSHDSSLQKFRVAESKYLEKRAITFGPPGNIWNDNVIDPLLKNDFKMMFSWDKTKYDLLTIPLSDNLKQNSLEEFKKDYEKKKEDLIYTLQFHHANLSEQQFELIKEVIDFLKNKEKRIFVTPSELLEISKKNKQVYDLMAPLK